MTDTYRLTSFRDNCRLLVLLAVVRQAAAAGPLLSLEFDSLEHESLQLRQVSIQLEHDTEEQYQFRLRAAQVRLPSGQVFTRVDLKCRTTLSLPVLQCRDGRMSLEYPGVGTVSGRLAFDYVLNGGLQRARLEEVRLAGAIVNATLEGPAPSWQLKADINGLDLNSAQSFARLTEYMGPVETLEGEVSGTIQAHGWPLENVQADIRLSNMNFAAESVAQAVSGEAHFSVVNKDNNWQGEINLSATAGEFYIVPPVTTLESPPGFYIAVGNEPVTLDAAFSYDGDTATLVIPDLDYVHPQVLRFNLAGHMKLMPAFALEGLSLRIPETTLEAAYPVYLQPWLISTPYNDLDVGGRAALELGISDEAISALSVKFNKVDMVDNNGRFAVQDLSTDIQMTENRQHSSRLSWDSLDIYRIGLGNGAIELVSNDFNIEVTRWQDVPLMDGTLRIEELALRDVGTPDFELHMAGAVESVSLPSLTKALDWPRLGGALSGEFSGLSYRQGNIRMDGELDVRMFDGRVSISKLNVRDLFGRLPVLRAEIGVRDIDLEQLTDTFAFGKITGKLGGHIHGLKLENWQPVAFDARLSTLDDGDTRHRISQKALNNLSRIGGGLRGALSRGFLAYFDEYSYGELGLSCRLANGFCELGGVGTHEQGHYLLTRGGLLPPWVEVKLAGSIIAWDALIRGFEQIAEGEVKIE